MADNMAADVAGSTSSGVPAPEDAKGVRGQEDSQRASKHSSKAGQKMAAAGRRAEELSTAKEKPAHILKSTLYSTFT
jgi:hypothetical protein